MADSQNLGFIFPGQGSQSVGMLSEFIDQPVIKKTFATASEVLGFDLWQLIAKGTKDQLQQTENTQPAILVASIALWRYWLERGGPQPVVMVGHSLGEYSALVAAGVLDFQDAVRLVRLRGILMQQAVALAQSGMAAILGLDDKAVIKCCVKASKSSGGIVEGANFNASGQVVIAGNEEALEQAIEFCQAAGAKKAIRLAVSVPSHCSLMQPVASDFAKHLEKTSFAQPTIAVVHNLDAEVSCDLDGIKQRLLLQLVSPVLWARCIAKASSMGATRLLECGPSNVLTALTKRIDRALTASSLDKKAQFQSALQQEKESTDA